MDLFAILHSDKFSVKFVEKCLETNFDKCLNPKGKLWTFIYQNTNVSNNFFYNCFLKNTIDWISFCIMRPIDESFFDRCMEYYSYDTTLFIDFEVFAEYMSEAFIEKHFNYFKDNWKLWIFLCGNPNLSYSFFEKNANYWMWNSECWFSLEEKMYEKLRKLQEKIEEESRNSNVLKLY